MAGAAKGMASSARWQATIDAPTAAIPARTARQTLHRHRAAGVERAAGRRIGRARDFADQRHPRLGPLRAPDRAPAPPPAAPACRDAAARRTAHRAAPARRAGRDTSPRPGRRHAAPPRGRARRTGYAMPSSRLQLDQQVEDLRAHRDVQRRDRLVAHQQRRPQRERAGDHDALPLAAGELVRIARARAPAAARPPPAAPPPARAAPAPRAMPRTSSGSPTAAPTVMRGLSEVAGSWNTICTSRPHRAAACARSAPRDLRRPCTRTLPRVGAHAGRRTALDDGRLAAAGLRPPARASRRRRSLNDDAIDRAHRRRRGARAKCTARSAISQHRRVMRHPRVRRASRRSGGRRRSRAAAAARRGSARRPAGSGRRSGSPAGTRAASAPVPSIVAEPRFRRVGQPRQRGQQQRRVGMARLREQRLRRPGLGDAPGIHHRDPVGDVGDHAHVVGDQHDRGAALAGERGAAGRGSAPGSSRRAPWSARRRSAPRAADQRRSRSSPAGTCRRTARTDTGRCRRAGSEMPTSSQHRAAPSPRGRPLRQPQRLRDLRADRGQRIERGLRLLEDHRRSRRPRSVAHRAFGQRRRCPSPASTIRPPTCRTAAGSSRITASAVSDLPQPHLADQRQHLAGRDGERHAVDHRAPAPIASVRSSTASGRRRASGLACAPARRCRSSCRHRR